MRRLTVLFIVASAVLPAAAQSMQLQPLPIALPKPLFEGTPALPKVPNLEKPSNKPRPPFLAPAGTTNVALHKPVSGSDSDPVIGSLEMITDGNKAGTDGAFVELKPGVQNVVVDLGANYTIFAVLIWHFHKEARAYAGVVAQVADDADFIGNVRTLFNNDTNNETGNGIGKEMRYVETSEGKLIDAKGVQARYLRLISNGSDKTPANHYIEVEVFGRPAQ